jgi:hypothetical protein
MTARRTETKAHLLATMQAISPPLEKLMADRVALREEIRAAQSALSEIECQIAAIRQVRDMGIRHYIAKGKTVSLIATIAALAALTLSLFTSLLEIKITIPLFISILIPLWLVDRAEHLFGKWHLHLNGAPTFAPNNCNSD